MTQYGRQSAELTALAALLDDNEDDARDAAAGLLPDELSALTLAASRLAEICGCLSRAVR